jgi:hypothetical protein
MMGVLKMEWGTAEKVHGSSPFFIIDGFQAVWEFELILKKKEKTLEHYGS